MQAKIVERPHRGALRLRVDETRPPRPHVGSSCVSCVATSDHRYGRDRTEATVFKKFGQKYGARWRLDGRVVREYRGPTPQREMFVLLALFHYRFLPDHVESELTYPVEFAVDYVRVFRRTP